MDYSAKKSTLRTFTGLIAGGFARSSMARRHAGCLQPEEFMGNAYFPCHRERSTHAAPKAPREFGGFKFPAIRIIRGELDKISYERVSPPVGRHHGYSLKSTFGRGSRCNASLFAACVVEHFGVRSSMLVFEGPSATTHVGNKHREQH